MQPNGVFTAIVPDLRDVALLVPELHGAGAPRESIRIAYHDAAEGRSFSRDAGIGAFIDDPESTLGGQLVDRHRTQYCLQALENGGVLVVVPMAERYAQIASVLHGRRADFGSTGTPPPVETPVRVPLRSENLDIQVYPVVDAVVEVHREIITERQRFEVPVVREEFVITRTDPKSGEEQTMRIPLQHEEISISKRTIVQEEVAVHRERIEQVVTVEEDLRREIPRVERS